MTDYKSSASQPPRPLDGQNGPQALGMVMGSNIGAGQPGDPTLLSDPDYMDAQKQRFNEILRNKKAKDSIRKFDKDKRLQKAQSMQRESHAPLSKYYKE